MEKIRGAERDRLIAQQVNDLLEFGIPRPRAFEQVGLHFKPPLSPDVVRRNYNRACQRQRALTERDPQALLQYIRQQHSVIRVMHICDVHFPYHRRDALHLVYQLTSLYQPHIIVVGSDQFDLSLLSDFDKNPDEDEATADILETLRPLYHEHIAQLKRAAPTCELFWIDGNHDARYMRWIENHAPKLRVTLASAWRDLISASGTVSIIQARELMVTEHLLVRHGDRHNIHAAKSLIEQEGYQTSVIAGHTHRPQRYEVQGRQFGVVGATSGCLCSLTPKYLHNKPSGWKLGTILASTHQPSKAVFVQHIEFIAHKRQLLALVGKDLLSTELTT